MGELPGEGTNPIYDRSGLLHGSRIITFAIAPLLVLLAADSLKYPSDGIEGVARNILATTLMSASGLLLGKNKFFSALGGMTTTGIAAYLSAGHGLEEFLSPEYGTLKQLWSSLPYSSYICFLIDSALTDGTATKRIFAITASIVKGTACLFSNIINRNHNESQ